MRVIVLIAASLIVTACSAPPPAPKGSAPAPGTASADASASANANPSPRCPPSPDAETVPERALHGQWQQAQTQAGGVSTWVDGAKQMPPSRFRPKMTLGPAGALSFRVLAPNDGHFFAEGRYTYREGVLEGRYDALGRSHVVRFEVCSLAGGTLTLRSP